MKASGLSVRRLAKLSGVDPSTINLWRNGGQERYRVENVTKVAPHLATTAEALLELAKMDEAPSHASSIPVTELELLRRLASLRPRLEQLVPELEDLVEEAGKASGAD